MPPTLLGLLACITVGGLFGVKKSRTLANASSTVQIGRWWDICIAVLTLLALIAMRVTSAIDRIKTPYGEYSY